MKSGRIKEASGMTIPEKYRAVEYSIARQSDGAWTWKLEPKKDREWPIAFGTTKGTKNNAIEAAHREIDKMIAAGKK